MTSKDWKEKYIKALEELAAVDQRIRKTHQRRTWERRRWPLFKAMLTQRPEAFMKEYCGHCGRTWPCPTIQALNGDR